MKAFKFIVLISFLSSINFIEPKLINRERVYGGVPAALGDFPFFAYLTVIDGNNLSMTCAGSFIRYNFILTSAFCLYQRVEVIVLGGHIRWRDFYEFHASVPGEDLILHESWNSNSLHINNIALIRLRHTTPEIFNGNYIRPIALPTSSDGQNSFEGYSLRAMGFAYWGELRSGDTRVILNSQCSQTFPLINSGNICVTPDYGTSPCNGDEGSPGMINRSGERILLGVFSGGNLETCNAVHPGVYTRVSSFLPWILSKIN